MSRVGRYKRTREKLILRKTYEVDVTLGMYWSPQYGEGCIGGPIQFLEYARAVRDILDPMGQGAGCDRSRIRFYFKCTRHRWTAALAVLEEQGWTCERVKALRRLMS